MRILPFFLLATSLLATSLHAQSFYNQSFYDRYKRTLDQTIADQPHWATPLVTVNPRLEQGFRTDFTRQRTAGQSTWNYGGAKGLQFVPFRHIEIRLSPPPFLTHSAPHSLDGFGDTAFRLKYRIYGSPEQRHNAIVTFDLNASIPTGKNGNGLCCATVAPVLELGKGFGKFDAITTAGGTLPITGTQKLGRNVAFNNALQYHATKIIWLEAETNTTYYLGGSHDGKQQTFITPGVIFSRIPLTKSLAISLAAGEQIALTHFNTYNHAPIFSARLRF